MRATYFTGQYGLTGKLKYHNNVLYIVKPLGTY